MERAGAGGGVHRGADGEGGGERQWGGGGGQQRGGGMEAVVAGWGQQWEFIQPLFRPSHHKYRSPKLLELKQS